MWKKNVNLDIRMAGIWQSNFYPIVNGMYAAMVVCTFVRLLSALSFHPKSRSNSYSFCLFILFDVIVCSRFFVIHLYRCDNDTHSDPAVTFYFIFYLHSLEAISVDKLIRKGGGLYLLRYKLQSLIQTVINAKWWCVHAIYRLLWRRVLCLPYHFEGWFLMKQLGIV